MANDNDKTECEGCLLQYLEQWNEDDLREISSPVGNYGWWCPKCLDYALSFQAQKVMKGSV